MNTTIISSQQIINFVEILKMFKAKSDMLMIICNGNIFVSDYQFSYMKHTNYNTEFLNNKCYYCYELKYLIWMLDKELHSVEIDMYGNLYIWLIGECEPITVMNNVISPIARDKILYCAYLDTNRLPYVQYDDISSDITIEQLKASLSKDGCIMYRKDGYMMTLYKGLLPLNKSDRLSMEIYPDDNGLFFTTKFTVIKKKMDINIYLRFRNLS